MLGVEIVEQDQIQIGSCRHLAAAQPAHRQDRGLLPLDPAVLGRELLAHQLMHGVNDAFGDIGKCSAGLLGRNRTGKNPRADQEQALLTKQPEPVEKFLVRTGILQSCGQTRR